jgi:hypothetical protein
MKRGGPARGTGVAMTRRELWQHWLERGTRALEEIGQRLLAWYESASAASRGVIPFRPVNPRTLGSGAAVAAGLLGIVLLSGSYYAARGVVARVLSSPPADTPEPTEFVLRCATCGGTRRVGWSELDDIDSRDGTYWCEKCRTYSAYRIQIDDACVALPFYTGEAP